MDDLHVQQGLVIPGGELSITTSRSGGPGGQHANKTSTRVTLEWTLADSTALDDVQRARLLQRMATYLTQDGVVQIHCDETRSQHRNREIAQERLAELVRNGLRTRKRRKKTKPSKAAKRRRLDAKTRRGKLKKTRKNPDPE